MAEMLWHREWYLSGGMSLLSQAAHGAMRGQQKSAAKPEPISTHRPKLPRPPNMSDDELPKGVYRGSQ